MSCRRPSLSGTACAWTPHRFYLWGCSLPPWGAARERSGVTINPPVGAPLLIFPRGHHLRSFPQVDTSARQRGFEVRVFPLLGELPKAIVPHLPVCLLYSLQLGPNMWSSPTTKSLDPIIVMRPSGGLPRGKQRTRHMWICLQFSGARGMDNVGVRAFCPLTP